MARPRFGSVRFGSVRGRPTALAAPPAPAPNRKNPNPNRKTESETGPLKGRNSRAWTCTATEYFVGKIPFVTCYLSKEAIRL